MRTLLDTDAAAGLTDRAMKLEIDSARRWGSMNVTEMLFHCNVCNRIILEETSKFKEPNLRERLIKFITLNILTSFPGNLKGPVLNNTKGLVNENEFEKQKQRFVETIQRFPVHDKPMTARQPLLGSLNTEEWGKFAWMHMDHHLRQFNV